MVCIQLTDFRDLSAPRISLKSVCLHKDYWPKICVFLSFCCDFNFFMTEVSLWLGFTGFYTVGIYLFLLVFIYSGFYMIETFAMKERISICIISIRWKPNYWFCFEIRGLKWLEVPFVITVQKQSSGCVL